MPAIATDQVTVLYDTGFSNRWTLYLLRDITDGDTFDVSNRFSRVELGTFITGQSTVVGSVTWSSSTPNQLTLSSTNMLEASGVLSLRGQSSTGVIP